MATSCLQNKSKSFSVALEALCYFPALNPNLVKGLMQQMFKSSGFRSLARSRMEFSASSPSQETLNYLSFKAKVTCPFSITSSFQIPVRKHQTAFPCNSCMAVSLLPSWHGHFLTKRLFFHDLPTKLGTAWRSELTIVCSIRLTHARQTVIVQETEWANTCISLLTRAPPIYIRHQLLCHSAHRCRPEPKILK